MPLLDPGAKTRKPSAAACVPDALGSRLLTWYRKHARRLPWRASRDPYAIWVSETMLQQTQVATVVDYYQRWMQRFPNVESLAQAEEAEVLHAWQGLGYYSRARRLLKASQELTKNHQGRLPKTVSELRELPGIGRYTAGAIASIAYGQPAPVVDGNVVRVLTRVFALRGDPSKNPVQHQLWQLAGKLVEQQPPGEINQALMELGATVCAPRRPSCTLCPVRSLCRAHTEALVERLPELPQPRAMVSETHVAALVERRGAVLVVRGAHGFNRWLGLWQFPHACLTQGALPEPLAVQQTRALTGVKAESPRFFMRLRHTVTHHRITLDSYRCKGRGTARALSCQEALWAPLESLPSLALPAPHRRLALRLMARVDRAGSP